MGGPIFETKSFELKQRVDEDIVVFLWSIGTGEIDSEKRDAEQTRA